MSIFKILKPAVADELLEEYSNIIAVEGPDSPRAKEMRVLHASNAEFLEYANVFDKIKRKVTGTTEGTMPQMAQPKARELEPA